MKNQKQLLIILLLLITGGVANAQVKGVSYTLSPTVEYTQWNKTTGINDGYLVGGQLGFGFGEFVELKANYLQSLNMKRDFSNLGLAGYKDGLLDDKDIDVTRWGGDLKINLSRGGLVPFLMVGTGVQSMKMDTMTARKNIYFSGGGGVQFSLGDRYTLAVQAVNTSFNDSPVRNLLSKGEQTALGVDPTKYGNELLKNWSLRASLLLYLGGRRPGELTDVDKAYLENFSSGFKGISLPIEISAGQLNFDKSLPYASAKFIGASSGFNFGQLVGVRAYYWRTMEDGYFSTPNRLAVYGGEGKFKLSLGQGLTPYLNVGGGVIDALSGYQIDGVDAEDLKNKPFVSGGLGLDLPFSRYVKLSAFAKALLTSNDLLETTTSPENLSTSWAYGLTMNFIVGSKSKNVNKVLNATYDEKVMAALSEERVKSDALKAEYEVKIKALEDEIQKAFNEGDSKKMAEKFEEKESAKAFVNKIDEVQRKEQMVNQSAKQTNNPMMLGISPSDFRSMIDELKSNNESSQTQLKQTLEMQDMKQSLVIEKLNLRLESIERSLNEMKLDTKSDQMDSRRQLQNEMDNLKRDIQTIQQSPTQVIIKDGVGQVVAPNEQVAAPVVSYLSEEQRNHRADNLAQQGFFSKLNYEGSSAFGGFNVGGNPTINLGFRGYYRSQESNFFIMPETFFGFGNPSSFGLFLNGIYEIKTKNAKNFTPYIGVGGGFLKIGEKGEDVIKLASNIVIGANLFKVAGGKFFVDLSGRNMFKHNQLVAGYRLPF